MGLLGGSKVPVAEPMKKYGVSTAEAAKVAEDAGLSLPRHTFLDLSLLALFLPQLTVAFPSCDFLSLCFAYNDWDLFQLLYFFLPLDLII